ncbi:MAG: NAD(P)-binding domain-containing protein [Gammaproteobacteria bacterium]|nr:NAD(P)-binding domain-containing protein [Gammaproteobacteria bacterium]
MRQTCRTAGAVDVVVIGAGHAGLAISHLLRARGVDHVVLERGEVANSWRHERWDSLHLLTPNWQTRLPGRSYDGNDPDGFMSVAELIGFLDDYAAESDAPVITGTEVTSVRREGGRYLVTCNHGTWRAQSVVLATGACNAPSVPRVAADLPASVKQLTAFDYRSPESVPAGGALIVGASATGLQLADELLKDGRDVTLAAGEHVRLPRQYRGKDIFYWLTQSGIHDQRYDEIEDLSRGRQLPSPQLVGSANVPLLDLNYLRDQGAQIAGRLMRVSDGTAQFSGSLGNVCALADLKMQRLLKTIDETADAERAPRAEAFPPTNVDNNPLLNLNFEKNNIRSVIWATGFRPNYGWLDVPVLDHKGRLRHDGGIVDAPGLYALGLPLLRRRKSSFIFGIEDDARDIAEHLIAYLKMPLRKAS